VSKINGLGHKLFTAGYDLSGDTGSLDSASGGPNLLDTTSIEDSVPSKIGGRRDGSLAFTSFFNTAAGRAHPVLSLYPTADVQAIYAMSVGSAMAVGDPSISLVAKQANYDGSIGADGAFTFSVNYEANGFGIEAGKMLTAGLRTDSTATNGASLDFGAASTLLGLQAFLQVTNITGTDATVKLQDSADDSAWADITGGAFAVVNSDNTEERIATSASLTIRRYIRVITTTSAGFSSLSFAVAFRRNLVAPAF